jgi:hypothetical protein
MLMPVPAMADMYQGLTHQTGALMFLLTVKVPFVSTMPGLITPIQDHQTLMVEVRVLDQLPCSSTEKHWPELAMPSAAEIFVPPEVQM